MNTEITFHPCPNPDCQRGIITTMAPAPIFGCKLKSSVHLAPSNEMCPTCKGCGRINVDGHAVSAPGFTVASFQRAIQRAQADNLVLGWTDRPDVFTVCRGVGMNNFYVTSRSSCSCKAGQAEMGCKHRARVILALNNCGVESAAIS